MPVTTYNPDTNAYIHAVETIMRERGLDPHEMGITSPIKQEFVDAIGDGQSPEEMVDDWEENGEVLAAFYAGEGFD